MGEEELKDNKVVEDVGAAAAEEPAGDQGEHEQDQEHAERKYTDADVDRIIAKKIAAERNRMSKLFNNEQQESEIEKRERDVLTRELKADAREAFIADGLPSSLSALLDYSGKEEYARSYEEVGKIFKTAIQQGVKDALRGDPPRVGTGKGSSIDYALKQAFAPKAR